MSNAGQRIRAVIFDFGGVLTRSAPSDGFRDMCRELSVTPEELGQALYGRDYWRKAQWGEITAAEYWRLVAAGLGVGLEKLRSAWKRFRGPDVINWDVMQIVRELRWSCKTAICSNAQDNLRTDSIAHYGIESFFDEIIVSGAERVAKPDPRIYRIALERLDCEPEEAVFVDDDPDNVAGAEKVGIRAIRFDDSLPAECLRERLREVGAPIEAPPGYPKPGPP